ncbi:hypothetical protein [Mycobacterium talmoniae]|uniref:Uncharacterized protein n=1 Tax=Mycobacterium talmoniae TaxID=1858794 RepID=A0A2S8BI84_9MYCO|nr:MULTISPECIES: hypothetical protein [Mycobacterium]PQM46397.1 hypothetical protein C1Y40_03429 [Mycobacterium talmoniae]TDH52900.1 hypothetical protein E2F47_13640 [Mycobacterium eburneum]
MTLDERVASWPPESRSTTQPTTDVHAPTHPATPVKTGAGRKSRRGREKTGAIVRAAMAVRWMFTGPTDRHRQIRALNDILESHRMEREMHRL